MKTTNKMQPLFDYYKFFLESCAGNKVVSQYLYVLEDYQDNDVKLNSYILYFFQQLISKLNLKPLFYQLSTFMLFQKILSDPIIYNKKNDFNDLRQFCSSIIKDFFKILPTNPVLFCEILFYKSRGVVDDILQPGAISLKLHQKENNRKPSSTSLIMEQQDNALLNSDDDNNDEVETYEVLNIHPWNEDEDNVLRQRYPTYCDEENCVDIIKTFLQIDMNSERTNAEVACRLKQLGLVKKKKKKRHKFIRKC